MCEHDYNRLHNSHLDLQDCMRHPIAFLAEMMGDVMYLHQALRQPDSREFVEAVIKEVNGHVDNNHWKLITCTEVPEGTEVVPSVWAMQHKQDLTTGKVTKHKARLNLHGGKQEFGTNYYKTYPPVVTWFTIRLLIVFGILFDFLIGPFTKSTLLHVHGTSHRDSHQAREFKGSHPQATCQHLRAKASRSRVEQLSYHQATGDQLQAVTY